MDNSFSEKLGYPLAKEFCSLQALVKNKLLLPTLSVIFPLMASAPNEDDDFDEEEEDDEVEDGTEASRPCAVASQVK